MNYCTPQDVVAYFKRTRLAALLDRAEEGVELDSQLVACVEVGNSMVDSYVRRQNTLPLTSIPPVLRQSAIGFTMAAIYRARSAKMPENESDWMQRDIEYLEKIANGEVVLEFQSLLQANQEVAAETTSPCTVQHPPRLFGATNFQRWFPGTNGNYGGGFYG